MGRGRPSSPSQMDAYPNDILTFKYTHSLNHSEKLNTLLFDSKASLVLSCWVTNCNKRMRRDYCLFINKHCFSPPGQDGAGSTVANNEQQEPAAAPMQNAEEPIASTSRVAGADDAQNGNNETKV